VFAIDPMVMSLNHIPHFGVFANPPDKVVIVKEDLFEFCGKVDVVTAIEIFEHMPDPGKFIKHLAQMCTYAFITTPLALETGTTSNPAHIAEYSSKDFDGIVGEYFNIEEKVYQTGDLRIVDAIETRGCDSYCSSHVVQMVWARSKYGR